MATEKRILDRSKSFVRPIALAKALEMRPQQIFQQIRNGTLKSVKDEEGKNALYVSEIQEYLEGRAHKLHEQLNRVEGFLNKVNKGEIGVVAKQIDEEVI